MVELVHSECPLVFIVKLDFGGNFVCKRVDLLFECGCVLTLINFAEFVFVANELLYVCR